LPPKLPKGFLANPIKGSRIKPATPHFFCGVQTTRSRKKGNKVSKNWSLALRGNFTVSTKKINIKK
jgi:hypothetical protein